MPENEILNPSRILMSLFHATADKLCIKSKPILTKLLQLSFSDALENTMLLQICEGAK